MAKHRQPARQVDQLHAQQRLDALDVTAVELAPRRLIVDREIRQTNGSSSLSLAGDPGEILDRRHFFLRLGPKCFRLDPELHALWQLELPE